MLPEQEEAAAKARKHLQHALQIYRQVLGGQEGNIYAANGVGAALAELGDIGTAQRVFREVGSLTSASRDFAVVDKCYCENLV